MISSFLLSVIPSTHTIRFFFFFFIDDYALGGADEHGEGEGDESSAMGLDHLDWAAIARQMEAEGVQSKRS